LSRPFSTLVIALVLATGPVASFAQGTQIALGASSFDASLPVEVSADSLAVDQSTGQAVFDGNVLVVQGEVRMSAGRIEVVYATGDNGAANGISLLRAEGGVTFVTAGDAAEAQTAVYDLAAATVTLDGNVLLTQGPSAISGDRLVMNLKTGNGRMEGRVRTVFTPGGAN
jgi:lipopolysaccharide export system protein LptA